MSRFSPYWLWALLALPAFGFAAQLATTSDPDVVHALLHPTGEFSARFMIIAMLASPLALVLRGWRGPQWLKRNRRYFGVAAFGYAALHTIFYLLDQGSLGAVIADAPKLSIWTGWFAFLIFIPLAATSVDSAVRRMGSSWKTLQRAVYAAAVLTLVHWAALHDWGGVGPALVHFAPLALLEAYRVWHWYLRPDRRRGQSRGRGRAFPREDSSF
ncbi:MAG: ferric reductase-like transmembrane domain-containing protein [Pseudomonadota bacterium]